MALYTKTQIQKMVQRLAKEIVRDYGEKELVLVILLKGALYFGVDLSRAIQRRRKTCKLYIEFMRVSSYSNARKSSGIVRITHDIERSLSGRHVLVVDDVADTCKTLAAVKKHILGKRPKSLKVCVAFNKTDQPDRKKIKLDYAGLKAKGFLVGYGLDDQGTSRAIEYITAES